MTGRQCAGIRRDGGRCTALVNGSQEYCYQHDPDQAARRKAASSKAAKARHKKDPEISELNRRVREVLDDVLSGEVDRADASVFFQGAGVLIRGLEQQRKIRETEELAAEVEELKVALGLSGAKGA